MFRIEYYITKTGRYLTFYAALKWNYSLNFLMPNIPKLWGKVKFLKPCSRRELDCEKWNIHKAGILRASITVSLEEIKFKCGSKHKSGSLANRDSGFCCICMWDHRVQVWHKPVAVFERKVKALKLNLPVVSASAKVTFPICAQTSRVTEHIIDSIDTIYFSKLSDLKCRFKSSVAAVTKISFYRTICPSNGRILLHSELSRL